MNSRRLLCTKQPIDLRANRIPAVLVCIMKHLHYLPNPVQSFEDCSQDSLIRALENHKMSRFMVRSRANATNVGRLPNDFCNSRARPSHLAGVKHNFRLVDLHRLIREVYTKKKPDCISAIGLVVVVKIRQYLLSHWWALSSAPKA